MTWTINPTTLKACQVALTTLPSAAAAGFLYGGGDTVLIGALICTSVLSAVGQVLHFNSATTNIINNLPLIVGAVQKAMQVNNGGNIQVQAPVDNVTDKR